MGKFILIVDDSPEKLEEAERAANAVFSDGEVRTLLFSRWDTRTAAELAWSIYQLRPDVVILDVDLARNVVGNTVAMRLRQLPGGFHIQIAMYTSQWEEGIKTSVARKPIPDVQYGAATPVFLRAELERLKLEKFSDK